jgi:hypothetical protein
MTVYLTDTHSLLWAFTRLRKLGENARRDLCESRLLLGFCWHMIFVKQPRRPSIEALNKQE